MRRSLTFKWVMTLLFSSLIGVALVGGFAYWTTATEFDRFVNETAQQDFIDDVTSYYQQNNGWQGVGEYLRSNDDSFDRRHDRNRQLFSLLSSDEVVLSESGPFKIGETVPGDFLTSSVELLVDDEVIGYVLSAEPPPGFSPEEQAYLDNTNRALLVGVVGASLVSLLVGLLLSRQFLRPLTTLTEAIMAMKSGDLDQKVDVTTNDELGQLADAFNQMSSQLHRANQLRKQMTADVAHDLRTPLHVMSGYIEAMRDGALPPTPERFDAMNQEANLLKRLVEDLRTLSLADSNALKLNYQSINPRELLQQVKETFKPIAQQEGVTITSDIKDDLPTVQMDRERMVQVLTNLVSNALRYTPTKGKITLAAYPAAAGVVLEVKDTGAGIPADQIENIFERFYRVDISRHEAQGESGLGLAIVKSIVEAHDGTVTASSQLNKGTTFTITLPA